MQLYNKCWNWCFRVETIKCFFYVWFSFAELCCVWEATVVDVGKDVGDYVLWGNLVAQGVVLYLGVYYKTVVGHLKLNNVIMYIVKLNK